MQRGFTLLEMLVVMVLMGLITALAVPAMQRWHDAVQMRARATGIVEALRAAAFAAGANRHETVMDEGSFLVAGTEPALHAEARAADRAAPQSAPTSAPAPVSGQNKLEITLPVGWRVERVTRARFMANGLCQPGEAAFKTERGEMLTVRVRGPVCGAELASVRESP